MGRNRGQTAGPLDRQSRFMTKVLRHRAADMGLEMRSDGFVRVEDLLKLQQLKDIGLEDVKAIVAADNKQRFGLQQEEDQTWWIRANQGHSMASVETEDLLEEVDLDGISLCLHGTYLRFWPLIVRDGLKRMQRNHIHFATGLPGDDGVLSGFRNSAEVLIYLDTVQAKKAGLKMYRSANQVLLSPGLGDSGVIPVTLFAKAVERRSGKLLWPIEEGKESQPPTAPTSDHQPRQGQLASKRKAGGHNKKLSHMLSRVLRHSAVDEGITIREDGFVRLEDLQTKLKRFENVTLDDVQAVVRDNDKQRFTLRQESDGSWIIRANQGHSMAVVKESFLLRELDPTTIDVCLHGTYKEAWAKIRKTGLSRMNRNHIHFARGLPSDSNGVISGMRKSCEVHLYIDASAAGKDGIKFFESDNGVILSPGNGDGIIPPKYFKSVTDRQGASLENLK
mmetsp:Transcript_21450/g.42113  ORF Transcript_21450/g.42113 Transcript_21450/m.42113 type:complete len:449 (+) Transcript_21450:152-1498(+)